MKIYIENCKSFKNVKFKINKLNFLIGENESGKSNFLDIIFNLINPNQTEKLKDNIDYNSEPQIIFSYNLNDSLLQKFKKLNRTKKTKKIKVYLLQNKNIQDFLVEEEIINVVSSNFLKLFINKKIENNVIDYTFEIKFQEKIKLFSLKKLEKWIKTLKEDHNTSGLSEMVENSSKLSKLLKEIFNFKEQFLIIKYDFLENKDNDLQLLESIKSKYVLEKSLLENKKFLLICEFLKLKISKFKRLIDLNSKQKSLSEDLDEYLIDDIKSDLQKIGTENLNNFLNLFWKTNSIKFRMKIEGKNILFSWTDKNNDNLIEILESKYRGIKKRSDGFKHFLKLILFISPTQKKDIKTIILLDEPDIFLHPKAVIDLKEYIKKLSQENKNMNFVISTHNRYFLDDQNFKDFSFLEKKFTHSIIIENCFLKSIDEKKSDILDPFLDALCWDKETFLELKNKNHVFLEGVSDLIVFKYFYNFFKNEYKEDLNFQNNVKKSNLLFLFMGGVNKWKSKIIDLSISFNNQEPYFLFDYDEAGFNIINKIKKSNIYNKIKNNLNYINNKNIDSDLIEIQKNPEKLEDCLIYWKKINQKNQKLKIENWSEYCLEVKKDKNNKKKLWSQKDIEHFKKIFEKIIEYFK